MEMRIYPKRYRIAYLVGKKVLISKNIIQKQDRIQNLELIQSNEQNIFQSHQKGANPIIEDKDNQDEHFDEKKPKTIYTTRSFKKKCEIINYYINHGKIATKLKFELAEGTLNSYITIFNKFGYEGFIDGRKSNHRPWDKKLDQALMTWIQEFRSKNLPLTRLMIRRKALELKAEDPNFKASNRWLTFFLNRNSLSWRKQTHSTQKLYKSFEEDAIHYFKKVEKLISSEDSCIFINFDETPISFDMSSDHTIHYKGEKDVTILKNRDNKRRVSLCLAVTSEGEWLNPMFIFAYKQSKRKNDKIIKNHPKKYAYLVHQIEQYIVRFNQSGFNEENLMIEWITKVLFKFSASKKVVLILDKVSFHCTKKIKELLKEKNIKRLIIPKGATSFLQPLDVSINKPLKDRLRQFYGEWLDKVATSIETYTTKKGYLKAPTYDTIVNWSLQSMKMIDKQVIKNSFIITGLSFGLTNKIIYLHKKIKEYLPNLISKFESCSIEPEKSHFKELLKDSIIESQEEFDAIRKDLFIGFVDNF